MAINLQFDLMGNPEPPSIILASRNGNKFGQLNVNVESIDVVDKFNDASELSFTLNKYIDGELTPYWDKVVDFKLIYCPEWDMWFEIKVELDETTETVKTVFCTQLGQAELSQIMLYNIEINTDADIEREDYKISILYDKDNPESSILHRLLEKAPHYSIAYVDESIQRMQRQFSFDDTSICDAFNEIAEEIGCLFVYNSNTKFDGTPNRTISVYDLQQNCNDCGHRGEFTDKCPECESTNIKYGFGEDTTIFVTSDELATEGIELVTDTDAVKNCFKLEAGDDLMTAAIRSCNPNGSDYIWYFSDALKADMSDALVNKLNSYDDLYQYYCNNHTSTLNGTSVNQYNSLVAKYKGYYDTPSTCLDCKTEGYFQEQCTNCKSKNILTGQSLQVISPTIVGYSDLMTAYYNTIDLGLYLKSGLMPNVNMSDTTAAAQLSLLTSSSLSPVAVNVKDVENISLTTANSAVVSMAKVLIRPTYKVGVVDGSSSLSDTNGEYKVWTGKLIVTNYSDENDSATSGIISVRINNDTVTFIEQKIEKALNKENTDDYSITGLFAKEYDEFCAELKKYALNPLNSCSQACDACLSILLEQGVGEDGSNESNAIEKAKKKELYDALYKPYYDKHQAINDEIKIRQDEVAIIEGVWDKSDENSPLCITKGLQQYIEECQKEIQDALNFENYLGESLWLEFCAYRREDKYSNDNYISDGLSNAELFEKANEFIEVAEEEIFKSAELQHSISATLNNLLALPKFAPLLKSFKVGNWIRVQADDEIYKLRLLEYGFSYGNSESISVEFSDVIKIKNGITDVQDIVSQASSMASSYDSVQRQAKKGDVARGTIDQWLIDGLNSANVRIKNNNNEEIVITKNGLLARTYSDITGTYSPEQFKLTHNIMAYTEDDWETVSTALGKHNYKYWDGDNKNFVDDVGYGFSAKFAQAAYVIGSQFIGGEIISYNYVPNESGTYFNLVDGDFDIAGGRFVYSKEANQLSIKDVNIDWSSSTNPDITFVVGLEDSINGLSTRIEINKESISSEVARATGAEGELSSKITQTAEQISSEVTDTKNELSSIITQTAEEIRSDVTDLESNLSSSIAQNADNIALKVSKGEVISEINMTPEEITISANRIDVDGVLDVEKLNALEIRAGSVDAEKLTGTTITGKTITGGSITIGNNAFSVDSNGVLSANGAKINGVLTAGQGSSLGGFKVDNNSLYKGAWDISSGTSPDVFMCTGSNNEYTIAGETMSGWCFGAGSSFGVNELGEMYCTAGKIGGWTIDEGELALYDGNDGLIAGLFNDYGSKYGNNAVGGVTRSDWVILTGSDFGVSAGGGLYCTAGRIGGWMIGESSLYANDNSLYLGTIGIEGSVGDDLVFKAGDKFGVTSDGILYAQNAEISGSINATSGSISTLQITGRLWFGNNSDYYIDPNYDNKSYYINLPEFKVDDDGAVFSGSLEAATGSFSGEIIAESGKIGNFELNNGCLLGDGFEVKHDCIEFSHGSWSGSIHSGDKGLLLSGGLELDDSLYLPSPNYISFGDYVGYTGDITIGGQTLKFMNGILIT